MSSRLPKLYLARHGDTDWTDSRRKTGRTDLPLNERGEQHARQLGERLQQFSFAQVFTSPLQRASQTCALAGFGKVRRGKLRTGRVGLRSLRGENNRRDPTGSAELGTISGRLSWRRITAGCGSACGSLRLAGARRRWRCLGVFQRPHHPHDCGPLAGIAARRWTILLLPTSKRRLA